jgi:hypothetical protein
MAFIVVLVMSPFLAKARRAALSSSCRRSSARSRF